MKDIEVLVKDAYADGVDMETLLSKVRVAYEVEKAAAAESERHEASIAAARKKAAEAMCEYMNVLEPEGNMSIEEAYALMEELEGMYDMCVPETQPTVKVYIGDEAKAKAESLVGDFESFIKSLGF